MPQQHQQKTVTESASTHLPSPSVPEKVEILNPDEYRNDPTLLTAILYEEDHTVGNALKHLICQMHGVEFCGYNIPHPLEDKILIRIQTEKGVSAGDILCQALKDLWQIFDDIHKKFTKAHGEFKSKGVNSAASDPMRNVEEME